MTIPMGLREGFGEFGSLLFDLVFFRFLFEGGEERMSGFHLLVGEEGGKRRGRKKEK